MPILTRPLLAAGLMMGCVFVAGAACPPAGWDTASLVRLRVAKFEGLEPAPRDALARGLIDCLADPRPELRDEIAFEALAAWLRAEELSVDTLHELRRELSARLVATDPQGFGRPFAALVLAEVARVDRLKPFLAPDERSQLVDTASAYLRGVTDRRGFDALQGWRHGVAHGADLLLQLGLNPALTPAQLDAIVQAITSQIAPAGEHFYVYGEPERLARPIVYIAKRTAGPGDAAYWERWLVALTAPAPLPSWDIAFKSQAGLARRHNTQAFVQVLYVMVRESGDAALQQRLLPGLAAARKSLP
jgi:hypothetical protein